MKAAINGFGRIGRAVMRQILADHPDIEVVVINDIAPLDMLAYLFRYDSTYGPFHGDIHTEDAALILNGRRIPVTQTADVQDLNVHDADILLECTGKMRRQADAQAALTQGVRDVLISGPCDATVPTVVIGANDDNLGAHRVVSNASCTTHAIAPLLALIDAQFGITAGHVTTVHCYTNSQPLVDGPRATPARSRAAAQSMIPTTTSATQVVSLVLPRLAGRLTGAALR
ncbi:MAG: type I glyceraldehyde-3-phosphate dehydrogenase, partial [Primorskyibacter sp.]